MNFFIETTDMDLGDTLIENIFLNDFMPMANGTFVKVYLLGFKYACDLDKTLDVTNQRLAKHLQIPLEDVLSAWDFWEDKGIIVKIPTGEEDYEYGVKFKNLKQLYIQNNHKVFKEKVENKSITTNDVIEANQNVMINNMFNNINDFIRRETTITEKMEILKWIQDYNMNPDVIEFAFSYAVEDKNIRYNHLKYVGGVIINWYDRGLTNMDAIMADFQSRDTRYYEYKEILTNIGISTKVTPDMKLKIECCKKSSGTSNPNINYIDKIMGDWHNKGIKSVEDIETLDKKDEKVVENRKYSTKKNNYKNRFHNFSQRTDQYTDQEIEDLAKKKREMIFGEFKGER